MSGLTFSVALLIVALFSSGALAQGTSAAPGDLELKAKKKTTVVTPKPGTGQATKDAEVVKKKIEARKRLDEATKPAPPARPDLDPGVSGGVQTKNLQREMKK